jgi:hypothetical protein
MSYRNEIQAGAAIHKLAGGHGKLSCFVGEESRSRYKSFGSAKRDVATLLGALRQERGLTGVYILFCFLFMSPE